MRKSGILLPVFSLPGLYGIGGFSGEAREFIDYLADAGQSLWQILPLGPTGYGDSPYQSFSTFAGNPYFIDLETLIRQGLLTREECHDQISPDPESIDYGFLYETRLDLLRKAFRRSSHRETEEFASFRKENAFWLSDYALFMALKEVHGGAALKTWAEELIRRDPDALDGWREKLSQETSFYEYLQFEFLRQWKSLKAYAGEIGIEVIGDLPIYVSEDSADFWAHPELFQVDERGRIRRVAGVPPDGFSADGQLWGNPLYNWDYHKKTGYEWWIRRIRKCTELYDVMRLDHFRGFDEYFSIPAEDHTAKNGVWEKGPGLDLFRALKKACPDLRIIAEDLGYVTDTVRQLVRDTGFPNMKILEFAFDSRDSTGRWEYMPYNYVRNCAVYTGTHDNETLTGWLDSILPEEAAEVREFFGVMEGTKQETVQAMIRAAFASTANLCIIPLQDYLGLDNRARINQPSTFGKNWKWRARKEQLDTELQERIRRLTELYGRTRL